MRRRDLHTATAGGTPLTMESSQPAPGAGVRKALDKVKAVLDSGSFYEAQQMYKSVYHRHRARKQLAEAYAILREGAILQLEHQQITCGVELGLLLLEAFNKDQVAASPEAAESVVQMLSAFPEPPSTSSASSSSIEGAGSDDQVVTRLEECSRLVLAAVKWAQSNGNEEAARTMHDAFAEYIWRTSGWRQLGRATLHFVRGSDSTLFAEVLSSCGELAQPSERDLFITRAVLQVLAVATKANTNAQLAHATSLFESFKKLQPNLDTPLMHFLQFLLKALAKRSQPLVDLLKQQYAPSLERDVSFVALLEKAEATYFNLQPPGGGLGGMLGNLLQSLSAMDGEEGDEEQ